MPAFFQLEALSAPGRRAQAVLIFGGYFLSFPVSLRITIRTGS